MVSAADITSEVNADGLCLHLPNLRSMCEPLREAILDYLQPVNLAPKTQFQLEVAIEETFMNQVWHAYDDGQTHDVCVRVAYDTQRLTLTFEDDGKAFDPTQASLAPVPDKLEDAVPGGLGLLLVREFAESVSYTRLQERNLLRISLKLV